MSKRPSKMRPSSFPTSTPLALEHRCAGHNRILADGRAGLSLLCMLSRYHRALGISAGFWAVSRAINSPRVLCARRMATSTEKQTAEQQPFGKGVQKGGQEDMRSLDRYLDSNYAPIGHTQRLPDGVEIYASGSTESHRGIVLIPDLFGWNTGRTRALADYFAEKGYFVAVPKLLTPQRVGETQGKEEESYFPNLFDLSKLGEYMKSFAYDTQLKPKLVSVMNNMDSCGVEKVSILSFSWGGWVTAYVLGDPDLAPKFCCAAIAHPSIHLEERIFGGSTQELLNRVQKPILFIPTRGDPDEYRTGGAYFESLKQRQQNSEVYDLPDIEHGFLPRGSVVNNQPNYEAVVNTVRKTLEFFNQNHD